MPTTTMSSREFNQDTSRAKKAAQNGPVVITDRGRPAHVLMSIDEYRKMTGESASIIDLLAMPGAENIDFTPSRAGNLIHPTDLS